MPVPLLMKRHLSFFLAAFLFAGLFPAAAAEPVLPRIASLNACTDELVLAVADKAQIAGLSRYPVQGMLEPEKGGENIRSLSGNAEEVLALKPDVVLAGPFTRPETLRFLEKSKFHVEKFDLPENFEDIFRDLRRVAGITGHPDKAESLITDMKTKLPQTEEKGPRPSVVFFGVAGHVVGGGTFEDAIIRTAGARNAAAEAGITSHRWISLEELIALKPDIIFLMEKTNQLNSAGQFLLHHPALHDALPKTRVYELPPRLLNCGTPASAEAVEIIRKAVREISP